MNTMKTTSITTIAKRFFFGNLLAATLFLSANANTGHNNSNFGPARAEVRYTGVDRDNQLSFKVTYSNPAGNTFSLTVLDEVGEPLYRAFYDEKSFNKTFKLPKWEISKLTFVIEEPKNDVKERYTVSVKSNVHEEVTVSKN